MAPVVTRQEVAALVGTMAEAWPWARIEPAQAEIWHRSLETVTSDDAFPTMLDVVRDRTKPPSIAEFLAHKRGRAYWRKMHNPKPELNMPMSERGPTGAAERHLHGQQWIAHCRAALHGTTPEPADNDDEGDT